jgi:hypothetical protein
VAVIFGAEIPDGLIFALLPVSFVMIVGLMAWIVRELGRITVQNARTEERHEDHERRIDALEQWRRAKP